MTDVHIEVSSREMSKKRLVVAGGNGFLGSRICKSAAARGWEVTSISRSGEPTWSAVTASPVAPSWANSVTWARADILKPATYQRYLVGSDAVVHSMGILLEADYKGVVSGRESIVSGLQRAFSPTKIGTSRNPLEEDELRPGERYGQITYELMNRDTAISLARSANEAGAETFVYISAAAAAPILPNRYITTKREAESTIASSLPQLRSIFVRPGFLYDSSRKFTIPIALGGFAGHAANSLIGGRLSGLMGAAVEKPLKADVVAEAVVEAIAQDDCRGVVNTKQIEDLATKAWRKTML